MQQGWARLKFKDTSFPVVQKGNHSFSLPINQDLTIMSQTLRCVHVFETRREVSTREEKLEL